MSCARIGLVGDFDRTVTAHQAIEKCFTLDQASGSLAVEQSWVGTDTIIPGDRSGFNDFAGIWCVPASPYRSTDGALWAIQYARQNQIPFLGTCGGFQHSVLEYARNVLGLKNAGHAELDPDTASPVLHQMQCALVEKVRKVLILQGSRFREMYGSDVGLEAFHCSYGLNPEFEHLFEDRSLEIVARSEDGGVRAMALRGHPFFVATLFQPERRALTGFVHPLVQAFFEACLQRTS